MDKVGVLVDADMDLPLRGSLRLHPVVPLVALLGLVHLGISLALLALVLPAHSGLALVKMELGAAIKVASMIVPCFMAMPLALRFAFTVLKICLPKSCFSNRWRKLRIVVSSGILSLIRSMPAKRRIIGIPISASSIAGSLRSYHCCIR
jgi:hypothetical protein